MASSSESTSKHMSNDQEHWQAATQEIVEETSHFVADKNNNFINVFEQLANKRQLLAVSLGHVHNAKEGSLPFGRLSRVNRVNFETLASMPESAKLLLQDIIPSHLKEQGNNTFEFGIKMPVQGKIAVNPGALLNQVLDFVSRNHEEIPDRSAVVRNFEERIRRNDEIWLVRIKVTFGEQSQVESFELTYPSYDKYEMTIKYVYAQQLYEQLLSWKPEQGVDVFLGAAAELSYFMAHIMPVDRGLQSMMEWMMMAIAKHKGIENYPISAIINDAPWTWAALLQPNLEQFKSDFIRAVSTKIIVPALDSPVFQTSSPSADNSAVTTKRQEPGQTSRDETSEKMTPLRRNAATLIGGVGAAIGAGLLAAGLVLALTPAGWGVLAIAGVIAGAVVAGGLIGGALGAGADKTVSRRGAVQRDLPDRENPEHRLDSYAHISSTIGFDKDRSLPASGQQQNNVDSSNIDELRHGFHKNKPNDSCEENSNEGPGF